MVFGSRLCGPPLTEIMYHIASTTLIVAYNNCIRFISFCGGGAGFFAGGGAGGFFAGGGAGGFFAGGGAVFFAGEGFFAGPSDIGFNIFN